EPRNPCIAVSHSLGRLRELFPEGFLSERFPMKRHTPTAEFMTYIVHSYETSPQSFQHGARGPVVRRLELTTIQPNLHGYSGGPRCLVASGNECVGFSRHQSRYPEQQRQLRQREGWE